LIHYLIVEPEVEITRAAPSSLAEVSGAGKELYHNSIHEARRSVWYALEDEMQALNGTRDVKGIREPGLLPVSVMLAGQ
jgi:hypothetical protein